MHHYLIIMFHFQVKKLRQKEDKEHDMVKQTAFKTVCTQWPHAKPLCRISPESTNYLILFSFLSVHTNQSSYSMDPNWGRIIQHCIFSIIIANNLDLGHFHCSPKITIIDYVSFVHSTSHLPKLLCIIFSEMQI